MMNECPCNNPQVVVQGEDVVLNYSLVQSACVPPFQPVDLSAATQITAKYLKSDGVTTISHTLTAAQIALVSGPLGKFTDSLSAAETALMNPGSGVDVIISYTIAGKTMIVVLKAYLIVQEQPF